MTDILEVVEVIEEEQIKTATIRGEGVRDCPFGLPVPEACENAGDSVGRMAPVEKKESTGKANRLVYAYCKTCKECPYANKILVENKKVDCNFGDTAAGKKTPAFVGSPLYPQTFSGIGLDGLYGYPLGYYADNNESRNLFFGLFSFLGFATKEELIKLADTYDKCGEKDKADIVDGLLKKMQQLKNEYGETFNKVQKFLEEYRVKHESNKMNTGLLWQLSQEWYGARQCNR